MPPMFSAATGEPVEVYVRELGEERGAAKMVVYELARLKEGAGHCRTSLKRGRA